MKYFLPFLFFFQIYPLLAFAQGSPPAIVKVAPIYQAEITENKGFQGLLYYERVSNISSEVTGLVKEIALRNGERVQEGDTLVHLNTELLQLEIKLAKTKVKQLDARIKHAKNNFTRLQSLLKQKGTSKQKYEDAEFNLLDAQLEQQAANETLAKLKLEKKKSTIIAPFSGIILEKHVDKGDWVGQGKGLLTLAASDELFVRVPVSEKMIRFIRPGEKVPVTLTASGQHIIGTLQDIAPKADPRTKNIFLKIHIPAQSMVAENMSATVFVPTSEKKTLSMIPRDALIKFKGKDFVYTVKDGKAAILPVTIVTYLDTEIGANNPYFVTGMPVVVEGNERLRPDQKVTVTNEKKQP